MSFTSSLGSASRLGAVLRAPSLGAMGQTVAIVVGAGLLAAVYQTMHEEMRTLLQAMRFRHRFRQARHETILMNVLGTELDVDLQDRLLHARDAFRAALTLLADPILSETERALIRQALRHAARPPGS